MAPSHFIEILERAFGELPLKIRSEAIPTIRGIIAACPGQSEAFEELIEVLENNDEIELYAKY